MSVHLGKTATDKVTGFKGVATGFASYLTGCDQYLLTPKASNDDKYPDGSWLDVNRLEFFEEVVVKIDTTTDKGPDLPAPGY